MGSYSGFSDHFFPVRAGEKGMNALLSHLCLAGLDAVRTFCCFLSLSVLFFRFLLPQPCTSPIVLFLQNARGLVKVLTRLYSWFVVGAPQVRSPSHFFVTPLFTASVCEPKAFVRMCCEASHLGQWNGEMLVSESCLLSDERRKSWREGKDKSIYWVVITRTLRFSFLTQSPGALDQTFCFQCSSTERYSIYKYRYIYFFFLGTFRLRVQRAM